MPQAGDRIGHYILDTFLAEGGMGQVWRAHHVETGEKAAIKLVGKFDSADGLTRFQREIAAVRDLGEHPNIIRLYEAGEENGMPYLAMEFAEGGSLDARLRGKGPLPLAEASRLLIDLAAGLDYAHVRGFVHRDIKPGNLLFTASGRLKIADFGLVRQMDSNTSLTRSQVYLGTLQYSAPEQIRGNASDSSVDIYAMGCVAYYMLTGRPPFLGEMTEVMYSHISKQPIPPSHLNPALPSSIDGVVLHALEKEPANRYQGATAFARDVAAVAAGRQVSQPHPSAPTIGSAPTVASAPTIGSSPTVAMPPGQGYPPPSTYPVQGYPPQSYPQGQEYQAGYPSQGYPPQSYPPRQGGYPPPSYPPQGYPPQPVEPQRRKRSLALPLILFGGLILVVALIAAIIASAGINRNSTPTAVAAATVTTAPVTGNTLDPTAIAAAQAGTVAAARTQTAAASSQATPGSVATVTPVPEQTAAQAATTAPPAPTTAAPVATTAPPPAPTTAPPPPVSAADQLLAGRGILVYVAKNNNVDNVVVVPFDKVAGEPRLLKGDLSTATEAVLSPDGKAIAFQTNALSPKDAKGQPTATELYIGTWQGDHFDNFERIDNGVTPDWAPDGNALVYVSEERGCNKHDDIITVGLDRSDPTRIRPRTDTYSNLTCDPKGFRKRWPRWSSQNTIVFARSEEVQGQRNMHLFSVKSSGSNQEMHDLGVGRTSSWSPDGQRLVFTAGPLDKEQVFVMNADGSNRQQITSDGVNARPQWLKNNIIVYNNTRDNTTRRLFAMRADGSGQSAITVGTNGDIYAPSVWIP